MKKFSTCAASIVVLAGVVVGSQSALSQAAAGSPSGSAPAPQQTNNGTIANTGTWNGNAPQRSGPPQAPTTGGAINNNAGGTYTQSGGTTTNAGTLNSSGAVKQPGGTINGGTITNNGTINDKR